MGRELGVTEEQLRDLPRYRESEAFSEEERLVIALAVEMTGTPVEVPPELMEKLRKRFDEAQLVELAAAISWENYRARFNRVFGVQAVGFSEGDYCALPEIPSHETRLHPTLSQKGVSTRRDASTGATSPRYSHPGGL